MTSGAASPGEKVGLIADGPGQGGSFEGLVSALVSALAREANLDAPAWVQHIGSPAPFFAFPARTL